MPSRVPLRRFFCAPAGEFSVRRHFTSGTGLGDGRHSHSGYALRIVITPTPLPLSIDSRNGSEALMAQEISRVATAYETERTGLAPRSVTAVLSDETPVITLHNALTPAEKPLALSTNGG